VYQLKGGEVYVKACGMCRGSNINEAYLPLILVYLRSLGLLQLWFLQLLFERYYHEFIVSEVRSYCFRPIYKFSIERLYSVV
jgi:hypothetical protein